MVGFLCFFFFFTQGSLVQGDLLISLHFATFVSFFNRASQGSCSVNSLRAFDSQDSLVKGTLEVSYYLSYSSFLYLYESATGASLVRSTQASKISYYLDFFSLIYLHRYGKGYLKVSRYSGFTSLFYFHVYTTCKMAFSVSPLWVEWHKVRVQSAGNLVAVSCWLATSLPLWETILPFYEGWDGENENYQISPNLNFNNFLLTHIISRYFKENKFIFRSFGNHSTQILELSFW